MTRRLTLFTALAVVLPAFSSGLIAADKTEPNEIAQFYGFSGVELYKLDGRAFNLASGDFDSDGRTDIIAVDNRSSCLRFFRQQTDPKSAKVKSGRYVNDLTSDRRFDIRQIPVDKLVGGLVSGDFNNDGRSDLAYVGNPDRLVIRYQPEPGKTEWTERWSVRLPDLTPSAWMISAGDLNGDKLTDIAVLGKNVTYVVHQNDDGTMKSPVPLINTSAQLSLLQCADIDGDGRDDLSYQANEGSARGLCARLQTKDGRLGPEVRFELNQPRSVTLHDVDQIPGKEILTVDSRTGRVVVSKVRKAEDKDSVLPKRLVQYGIGESTGRERRAVAVGDIDGDGRNDVVITDPEKAQVLVYRQNGIDGLGTVEAFPGLLGAVNAVIADVDGDRQADVILMSDKEAAIAVSSFKEGRLTFPKTVARPPEGFEYAAMTYLPRRNGAVLAVCLKKGSGSSSSIQLQQLAVSKEAAWKEAAETQTLDSSVIGTRGLSLTTLDADRNGSADLLFIPSGTSSSGITLLTTDADGKLNADRRTKPLNLGTSAAGELFEHDGELYAAREAFARRMKFEAGQWTIADQFNAGESRARIAGVAVLELTGDDSSEIVLIDTGVKKLRVLKKSEGLYRPWQEVELGSVRYTSAHVADLNGDAKDDLLLFGKQQFAVMYSGGDGSELAEIATWESDREDAYAADIIAGDINGDGGIDLTVIDTSIDGVELLRFDTDKGINPATHFRIFEEKRLVSKSNARGTEPREGVIADVTGDGRNDLVLLCHDRLIVYPQDTGEEPENAGK